MGRSGMEAPVDTIQPGSVARYADLRDYLEIVDALGELRRANGADLHLEIGAICALARESSLIPATLCDNIPGLEPGFRILLNPMSSLNRTALAVGLPLGLTRAEYNKLGTEKWRSLAPIPPRLVADGPVLENVQEGDRIDLARFPRPHWHDGDGGPYMGTADAVVTRDPETDWVNVGTYRVMYQDSTHVSVYINPDNHGRLHQDRYFKQSRACPVLISLGHDPLLFGMATQRLPNGSCEYDYVGGLRGEPMDVILEHHTGLPMPAQSELVIAGEIRQDDVRPEGPFGETFGYYASGVQDLPTVEVKAVYFRNHPIILGSPPSRPPRQPGGTSFLSILHGEGLLDRMRRSVPGVKDVYSYQPTGGHLAIVSIQQQYPGHAKQAGLALANNSGHRPRYAVVVDDDVNIRDLQEVLWVLCTRSDPIKDIEIITRTTSSPVEPIIPPWENDLMSRAIIDATRPFEWLDKFPKTVEVSPELREHVWTRWAHVIA
ncbi:MAG: UbiD family decarboxylase [Chloroflexi bacterium]|nr:UbiD family decarboxylase [Chloroflexota bacterium]